MVQVSQCVVASEGFVESEMAEGAGSAVAVPVPQVENGVGPETLQGAGPTAGSVPVDVDEDLAPGSGCEQGGQTRQPRPTPEVFRPPHPRETRRGTRCPTGSRATRISTTWSAGASARQARAREGTLAGSPMILRSSLADGRRKGGIMTRALQFRTRGRTSAQQPRFRRCVKCRLALLGTEDVNPWVQAPSASNADAPGAFAPTPRWLRRRRC